MNSQNWIFPSAVVCICCIYFGLSYSPKSPVIYTKYGPVIGVTELSRGKREYVSYRGIPYAKPPIGDLRFKAPEPPEPWSFGINATQDPPFCIQKNYFFEDPKVEGSEDCLYLNIYTPYANCNKLLPVMVFIHWGGFFAGRGTSDYIGPEYFMDKDVILVTFNYRLGVFGFFSTLDDAAPGNFGLKDQVLALKFVQEIIGCFGGDKNKVTIFGQSAGAGSVSLHMTSPASKGLFQQAISQSGVALDLWAKPQNAVQPQVIAGLALFTGCSQHLNQTQDLVQCLRNVDAKDLAETADKFKYFQIEPLTPYSVVTETMTDSNPEPFLTKDPLTIIQEGDFSKVPFMVGAVQDEGILRVAPLLRQLDTLRVFNSNFTDVLPKMLGVQLSNPKDPESLFNNIVQFYLDGNTRIDVNNSSIVQGLIDLYTDRVFSYGIYQTIILQSQKGHTPIWVYNFDYKGQYTFGDLFAATSNNINFNWGVSHCDDLLYLFRSPALFPDLKDETDLKISETMIQLWTNFAIYGNPDHFNALHWSSLSFNSSEDIKNENINYLNISGSSSDHSMQFNIQQGGLYPERTQFWIGQNIAENFPGLH